VLRPAEIKRGAQLSGESQVLRLSELKLSLDHSEADLVLAVCQRLRLSPAQLKGHRLVKRSVDARKRQAIA